MRRTCITTGDSEEFTGRLVESVDFARSLRALD